MTRSLALSLAAVAAFALAGTASAADRNAREVASFGMLHAPAADAVKAQAAEWLTAAGKTDAASRKAFDAAFADERPVLDAVADVLSIGDADAAKLLAEVRDPNSPAPTEVPAAIKDKSKPAFLRANLALAYAKALSNRRVFEEALDALKTAKAEEVVDPASFYFHKAVAEHSMMLKREASDSVGRLLDDVADAPERYRMVGALMLFDMMTWQDKDLGWVARKMDNIERRLDLSRGGKKTQKMQKEVVARLDEMIKELENQKSGCCNCPNGGNCNGNNKMKPGNPLNDSKLGGISGAGEVDPKKMKEIAQVWGKLPEKERAKAMLELTRDLDPKYRDAIESYLKRIATESSK
jgi:tetratricopeptide (TPR) repeat protein